MFPAARISPQTSRTLRDAVIAMDPPNPNHHPRAASFFGGLLFVVLLALVLTAVAALGGCDSRLSNEEIVRQVDYCKAHGLKPVALSNFDQPAVIVAVQCEVSK